MDPELLSSKGAVSRETAIAMAEGALRVSGADIAVAVTGIAGPEGDGSSVPVGTIWTATALKGSDSRAVLRHYDGERNTVRESSARDSLVDALGRLSEISLAGEIPG
jgi:PncC family amidohydrolase